MQNFPMLSTMLMAVVVAGCAKHQARSESASQILGRPTSPSGAGATPYVDPVLSALPADATPEQICVQRDRDNAQREQVFMLLAEGSGVPYRRIRVTAGTVVTPRYGVLWAPTSAPIERYWTLVVADDLDGIFDMIDSGQVVFTTGQMRVIQQVGNACEVRMLGGPDAGQAGWVNAPAIHNR